MLLKRRRYFVAASLLGYAWTFIFLAGQLDKAPSSLNNTTETLALTILSSQTKKELPVSLEAFSSKYGRLRLNWYANTQTLPQLGEVWQLEVKLKPWRSLQNFQQSPFYLANLAKGQVASGYVAINAQAQRLQEAQGIAAFKQNLLQQAEKFNQQPNKELNQELSSGWRFLFALGLGAQELLTFADWQILQQTGTAHLWVVSGLHLGLLAGLALWLLPKLGLSGVYVWLGAASLALGYAYLAGFGVAAQRAGIMLVLGLLLLSGWRKMSPSLIFSLALLAILLTNPLIILSKGFWLSFVAVASLLLAFSGQQPQNNLPKWLAAVINLFKLQLVMFLAFSPVLFYLDIWVGLASWPINFLLVPLVGFLLLPASLVTLSLAVLGWGLPLYWLVEVFQLLANLLTHLADWNNFSLFRWFSFSAIQQPVYLWLGTLILLPRGLPIRHFAWLGWLLAVQPLATDEVLPNPLEENNAAWQVRVLDVGQGTAILVTSQGQSLLYDTGRGFGSGQAAVVATVKPWLTASGLTYLAISHDDLDHSGGVEAVKARWPIQQEISAQQANCFAGQTWQLGALKIEALWPPRPPLSAGKTRANNEDSCVLLVTSPEVEGKFASLLLTGDAGLAEEAFFSQALPSLLTSSNGEQQPLSLLIAGHHGSKTSTSQTLLQASQPLWAVHTNGWRNSYGHPHKEVELRLRQAGIQQLATASQGGILFNFLPATYPEAAQVEYKNQQPSLIHYLSYKR